VSARYSPGEILLAAMVFSTQTGTKNRPVLVVHDTGDDDLIVAPVTSHAGRSVQDVFLNDWQQAGLRLPSVARLDKLATIEKGTVIRPLGKVTGTNRSQLKAVLQQWFHAVLAGW
jgi:mRNA interferase MazF